MQRELFYTKIKLTIYLQTLDSPPKYGHIDWKGFFEKEPDFEDNFKNIYKIISISLIKKKYYDNNIFSEKKIMNILKNNLILKEDFDNSYFLIALNLPDHVDAVDWENLYNHYKTTGIYYLCHEATLNY